MFQSLEEIINKCNCEKKRFWKIIMEDDMQERNVKADSSYQQMKDTWDAMLLAAANYDKNKKSASGLIGGDGYKMEEYLKNNQCLCGDFLGQVIAGSLQMGESNACMKRIVAAPTAGACGVLPAILIPYFKASKNTDHIAYRASISGAQGGCQAEIGSASAMAAGALVYLEGGKDAEIVEAAAMALKNLLGLVCDPVAGLVEVPCIKRNVCGAVNAVSSAEMALAGITSRIPADQVIDAMKELGDKMDASLKETGLGGLAATAFGKEITNKII